MSKETFVSIKAAAEILKVTVDALIQLHDAFMGPKVARPGSSRPFRLIDVLRCGAPLWPYWENVRSWWKIRHLPNVKLIHFNELKANLPGMIREIARFLDVAIDENRFTEIVEHCTFDYMKAHAERIAPRGGAFWKGGAATFINKGTNGRWRDTLSEAEIKAYEIKAQKELGPACANWLAHGKVK